MAKDFAISLKKRNLKRKTNALVSKITKNPLMFVGGLLVAFIVLPVLFIAVITKDLPTPDNITRNAKYSSSVLDRNSKVIYQIYDEKNIIPINIKEVPANLKNATIAIEDKNFYKHGGFSIWGIVRSMVKNIVFRRIEGGGSTITQQLIKNSLLSTEQTMMRKVKELILAVELERRYDKDQILEMYLNQTPYGGTAWGVEAAANYYFNKHIDELSLIQSAIIAGMPQSPSRYSPFIGEKDAYINRTKEVLRRMREDKYITKQQEKDVVAKLPSVQFSEQKANFPAPHFIFYIKDILDKQITNNAIYQKGLVIKSTLDLDLQKEVEKIVKEELGKTQGLNISNAAVVVVDPKSGEILAMVGSKDFSNDKFGKFNAALGLRQPGSTLKPFTYALALENGYTASTPIMDVSTEFTTGQLTDKPYVPVNYDGKFHGPVQLRMALGSSINIPAVKVLARVGVKNLLQLLYDAGLTTLSPSNKNLNRFGLSLTLGGGEVKLVDLVSSYTTLANNGVATSLQSIKEVRDFRNKLIFKSKNPVKKKVMSEETSFIISHILSDNNARLLGFGANNYLNISGRTVAAKTGTTDDKRDNWTIGYTKDLVVGVWVGNNDNSPMNQALASGVSGAAPIWRRIFLSAFNLGYKDGLMEIPKGVMALEIDALFGGLPYDGSPIRSDYFKVGTEPKEVSPYYQKLKISKNTGKLANQTEIAKGEFDEKEFYVVTEQDPLSTDGTNRWQKAIDEYANGQDNDKWKPPKDKSDGNPDEITISVLEPGNNSKSDNNQIRLYAKVGSSFPLRYFEVLVNGQSKIKTNNTIIDEQINLDDGVYKLTFKAQNEKDKSTETEITIGIKKDPEQQNEVTPEPTVDANTTP